MKADARREDIATYVIGHGEVRIDDLIERFGVSRMTIHREIDRLAQQGVLRKLHGAVSALPSGIYESLFEYRQTVATAAKAALARAALAHVEAGQVLMLDDSTTAGALAPLVPNVGPLTVVTNSFSVSAQLRGRDGIDLIQLGGQYHRTYDAFIGHVCESAVSRLRADLLVCSASAVSDGATFMQDGQVVRVKQAMMAAATKRVLLLDHAKFGKAALHRFADLASFDTVLVTAGLGQDAANALEQAGVRLRLVDTP